MRFFSIMCLITSIVSIQKVSGGNDEAHVAALEAERIVLCAETDALGDQLRYSTASEKVAAAKSESYSDQLDQHEASFYDRLREKFLQHMDRTWEYDFSMVDKYEKTIETQVKSGNR